MISNELQKELSAKYNPDGSELRRLQEHLLILLDKFDLFCKKNSLQYWLSSGTCLGAVRHGGFIPWDDDIDVEMTREDYLKFIKLWKDDDDFILQTYQNDLYYTLPFPKLRLRKTSVQEGEKYRTGLYEKNGIFLDIFIMERSNVFVAKFCHFILGSLRHLSFHFSKGRLQDTVFFVIKKICFGIVQTMRMFWWASNENQLRHTLGTGVEKNVRITYDIFPLTTIEFEGLKYPVPNDFDSYLKKMFGDYNIIPQSIYTHTLKEIEFLPANDYDRLFNKSRY